MCSHHCSLLGKCHPAKCITDQSSGKPYSGIQGSGIGYIIGKRNISVQIHADASVPPADAVIGAERGLLVNAPLQSSIILPQLIPADAGNTISEINGIA